MIRVIQVESGGTAVLPKTKSPIRIISIQTFVTIASGGTDTVLCVLNVLSGGVALIVVSPAEVQTQDAAVNKFAFITWGFGLADTAKTIGDFVYITRGFPQSLLVNDTMDVTINTVGLAAPSTTFSESYACVQDAP